MELSEFLKKTNKSVYSLSKESGIPYSTTLSICRGKANIEECRLGTLRALAAALNVGLLDFINGDFILKKHNFINDDVNLDAESLPKPLQTFIAELEEFDRSNDPAFYAATDTMFLMADRYLKNGDIKNDTYKKLIAKYPLGE